MKQYHFLLQHDFIDAVKHFPEKTALIINDHSFSYKKLYEDVLQFSHFLLEKQVMRSDRVVIQTGNSYFTILAFYAAIFCDAVPCIIDQYFPQAVIDALIASLSPKYIISQEEVFEVSLKNSATSHFKNTEEDIAMIMHTSGSTGVPKGVVLSHRNVVSAVASIQSYLVLRHEDVILSALPLHFDYGLYQLFLSIHVGATLVLVEDGLLSATLPKQFLKYCVTVFPLVPYLLKIVEALANHISEQFLSVRIVTNTGENLTKKHIQKIQFIFPKATIFSMFGLTECKRCSYVPPDKLFEKAESIGIPMPNLEMWVEDNAGVRLTSGIIGNLVVSGPSVMKGYWNNNEETLRKLVFKNGIKKLITGDKAFMDQDGYFYFKGREDGILKYKGAKFFPQDYLKKINLLPFVFRAYLFLDEEHLLVCLEVAPKVDSDEIKRQVLSFFPVTQKPSFLYSTENFPVLSNGKIDKNRLESLSKISFYRKNME